MHSIVDILTRVVLDYLVTDRNVAGITGLRTMLERFEGGFGNFCLDSAMGLQPPACLEKGGKRVENKRFLRGQQPRYVKSHSLLILHGAHPPPACPNYCNPPIFQTSIT